MNQIAKRRELIGTGIDMAVQASQLLEKPDGKRALARRAIASGFKTDKETFTNLCGDPNDGLYMKELCELCHILQIPSLGTKADITTRLKQYVEEALTCSNNLPTKTSLEEAEKMFRINNNHGMRISAGMHHALAITDDGKIRTWGNNTRGQCDISKSDGRFIAVSACGISSMGLRDDGTLVTNHLGEIKYGIQYESIRFVAISVGVNHALHLTEDGQVITSGCSVRGRCTIPKYHKKFIAISAGLYHLLVLAEDGKVLSCCGDNTVPKSDKRFIAISSGNGHSLALDEDGTIISWGANGHGQCNVPKSDKRFIAISAGDLNSLAITEDGGVMAWGSNIWGECNVPELNKKVIAISAGYMYSMALADDGEILFWGHAPM